MIKGYIWKKINLKKKKRDNKIIKKKLIILHTNSRESFKSVILGSREKGFRMTRSVNLWVEITHKLNDLPPF